MTKKVVTSGSVSPASRDLRLRRGFWLALSLALVFLAGTAVQSAATLSWRVRGSLMTAATGAMWSGQIGREILYFLVALLFLHLAFGAVIWGLGLATTVVWPGARERFGQIVLLWFCLMAAAAIAYNVVWFPRTGLGAYYHDAAATPLGPFAAGQVLYLLVTAAAVLVVLAAAWAVARRIGFARLRLPLGIGAAVLAMIVVSALVAGHRSSAKAAVVQQQPHVILLGVDSLRLDQLQRFGGTGVTKHLDQFLAKADIVRDTTTPAARTFPSWTAILTGRSPRLTGTRFNLASRNSVKVNPTLGDALRDAGYRTIYSTDEVRFANFDESYGFDQVVTPPIGAIDFVIGNYNELPLTSVVANSRLGKWLFPYSYANRGAATLFQPQTYLSRLEREVSFDDGPTLFIAHLTASHWPYFISDTPFGVTEKKHADDRPLYRLGLETADEMFGALVEMLERKGALRNAIVVVLSDHGEALALPNDAMLTNESKIEGLRAPLLVMDTGHGQSVLSPVQYQVLLGFRTFGPDAGFAARGRDLAGSATVEDIAPTLLELAHVPGNPLSASGLSFAPLLRSEPGWARVGSAQRVRFTETDLRVLPSTDGGVDEVATANQNSKFFEVDSGSGRMHIRENFAPLVLAYKERAAFTDTLFLAALPAGPDAHQYLLVDRTTGNGRLLMERPSPESVAERNLWDALAAEFPGELKPAVSIVPEDWPALHRAWEQFFVTRATRAKAAVMAGQ